MTTLAGTIMRMPIADTIASPSHASEAEFFRGHGYVVLPTLSREELAELVEIYDRDRREFAWNWRLFGSHQFIHCDALVTSPVIDRAIRHPRILPAVERLMGGPVCFSEICLRHMAEHAGKFTQSWHRDRPHRDDHPFRMDYIQAMIYLTDVTPETHCFSISPEAADAPVLRQEEQLAQRGTVDFHGPAGTVVLFNVAVLHTATVRPTKLERKTIQTYYGHRDRPHLSEDSLIPATLWRDHHDPETRAFYGNLNVKTRLYHAAMGGARSA